MFALAVLFLAVPSDAWLPDHEFDAYRNPDAIRTLDSMWQSTRASVARDLRRSPTHGSVGVAFLVAHYVFSDAHTRNRVNEMRGRERARLLGWSPFYQ